MYQQRVINLCTNWCLNPKFFSARWRLLIFIPSVGCRNQRIKTLGGSASLESKHESNMINITRIHLSLYKHSCRDVVEYLKVASVWKTYQSWVIFIFIRFDCQAKLFTSIVSSSFSCAWMIFRVLRYFRYFSFSVILCSFFISVFFYIIYNRFASLHHD